MCGHLAIFSLTIIEFMHSKSLDDLALQNSVGCGYCRTIILSIPALQYNQKQLAVQWTFGVGWLFECKARSYVTNAHTSTQTHSHVCVRACISIYARAHTHAHIRTHTNMHTHTMSYVRP